jgi:hypothetical protein
VRRRRREGGLGCDGANAPERGRKRGRLRRCRGARPEGAAAAARRLARAGIPHGVVHEPHEEEDEHGQTEVRVCGGGAARARARGRLGSGRARGALSRGGADGPARPWSRAAGAARNAPPMTSMVGGATCCASPLLFTLPESGEHDGSWSSAIVAVGVAARTAGGLVGRSAVPGPVRGHGLRELTAEDVSGPASTTQDEHDERRQGDGKDGLGCGNHRRRRLSPATQPLQP